MRGVKRWRRSRDRKMNKEGSVLVSGLEQVWWYIFNRCGKGDEEGEWTYAGGREESVLDYVIGDKEVWERVERDKVGEKIESDHFPVVVWIKGRDEIIRRG